MLDANTWQVLCFLTAAVGSIYCHFTLLPTQCSRCAVLHPPVTCCCCCLLHSGVAQLWSGRFGVLDSAAGTFQPWAQPGSTQQQPAAAESEGNGSFFANLMQQRGVLSTSIYTGTPSMQAVCGHMVRTLESSGKGQVVLSCKVHEGSFMHEGCLAAAKTDQLLQQACCRLRFKDSS